MALVTVTADFGRADESDAQGWVSIRPWLDAVHTVPDLELVTRAQLRSELVAGVWTAAVIASDDPAWQTDGMVPYFVEWTVSGSYATRIIELPGPGPWSLWELVDLADPAVTPIPVPGPVGPPPALVDGTTTTLPPGSPATSDVVPVEGFEGLYQLDFGIPAGVKGDKGDKGDQGLQGEVAVGTTTTGNPGTAAAVVDADPAATRALLNFTIPRGDVGATGPAIGAILTTKGDLAVRDATTAVRLPVGAANQVLTPDSTAATGVKWGAVPGAGNLLTDNQASGTDTLGDTTGLYNHATHWAATASTEQAAQGTKSWKLARLTTTATTSFSTCHLTTGVDAVPVFGGETYTLAASLRAGVGTTPLQWRLRWFNAGGTAAVVEGPTLTAPTAAAFTDYRWTVAAPATAVKAGIELLNTATGTVGDSVYIDRLGFWKGAGGDWAMPGTPITGLHSAWEQVAALADLPATGNWLGRQIRVTGGLGLQVMVWNGSAWVVDPASDTGWRAVTGRLNSWAGGVYQIRRVGGMASFRVHNVDATAATSDVALDVAVGWRPTSMSSLSTAFAVMASATLSSGTIGRSGGAVNEFIVMDRSVSPKLRSATYSTVTDDAWPTAAPA